MREEKRTIEGLSYSLYRTTWCLARAKRIKDGALATGRKCVIEDSRPVDNEDRYKIWVEDKP